MRKISLLIIVLAGLLVPAPAGGHGKLHCKRISSEAFFRGQVDPIAMRGEPQSMHSHDFFGNQLLLRLPQPELATYDQLVGGPTDCQNKTDSALYWVPTLMAGGRPLDPFSFIAYYRDFDRDLTGTGVEAYPPDMRLVAGDPQGTGPQPLSVVNWSCGFTSSRPGPYRSPVEAACHRASGKAFLTSHISFPTCWDGQLNDHATMGDTTDTEHVVYPVRKACPAGFPHKLPELRMTLKWDYQGDGRDVTLASGSPYTMHGDFWNTWVQTGLEQMVDQCINTSSGHPHGSQTVCGFPFPGGGGGGRSSAAATAAGAATDPALVEPAPGASGATDPALV
ncbi:MAG TPA: DUF1996 domain-containing protein, partial [Actinomycetota bacterium]|nr:DUF1996 domain-containing protein [Actinomycetota bacterium]